MKTVHFVTTNKGKVHSLRAILEPYGIEVIHANRHLPEIRSEDPQEIAKDKVKHALKIVGGPVIALDAGFFIESLNGFPRTFVNFSLETIGLEGILKLVEGKGRACEFRNCIAFLDATLKEPVSFMTSLPGTLAEAPRGELAERAWSPLYQLVIPNGYTKTLAEMSDDEYRSFQQKVHQYSYAAQFARWFVDRQ